MSSTHTGKIRIKGLLLKAPGKGAPKRGHFYCKVKSWRGENTELCSPPELDLFPAAWLHFRLQAATLALGVAEVPFRSCNHSFTYAWLYQTLQEAWTHPARPKFHPERVGIVDQ